MKTTARMIAAVAAIGLSAMLSPAQAQSPQKIVLAQPNPNGWTTGFASFFLAQKLGYFAEEGLEIDVVNLGGDGVVFPQIAQKKADIGWGLPIFFGLDPVPPLRFFYNHIRRNIWEIGVPADSPVQTLKDLKGRKVGVGQLNWNSVPVLRALMREAAGFRDGSDYDILAVGQGPTAFRALDSGEIHALNIFDTMLVLYEQTGKKLRRIEQPPKYDNLFANAFYAHADTIRDKPKMLAGFGRAWTRGMVACNLNVSGCINSYFQMFPSRKPAGVADEVNLRNGTQIIETRNRFVVPAAGQRWGEFALQDWRNYVDILQSQGVIAKSAPAESLFTNQFVAEFNRFDAEALKRQAAALK